MQIMVNVMETLIVEDNPGDACALRCLLAGIDRLDFRIDHAVSLEDALDRAAKNAYNLIFLDLNLPDSIGYQTFERMLAAAPDAPIIVMTGVEDPTVASAAIHGGVQVYIVKDSINSSGLSYAIRDACERKRKECESRH
jgi:sigma-B regulation protein RsbU (phosphoserine phosphatase)